LTATARGPSSTLGASATVGGLCPAAERHVRWAAAVTLYELRSLGEFVAAPATVGTSSRRVPMKVLKWVGVLVAVYAGFVVAF